MGEEAGSGPLRSLDPHPPVRSETRMGVKGARAPLIPSLLHFFSKDDRSILVRLPQPDSPR